MCVGILRGMRWRYFWLALVFAWFVIREILDGVGRIQAAKEIFVHRGKLMALLGDFLTWRWSPVVSFAVLVLAFACITYLPDCIAAISGSAKSSIQATSTGDKVPTVHDMYLRDFQSLNSINKEIEYRSTDGSQSVK